MGCNCRKITVIVAPTSKFGACAFCMYVTLAGFICSWLLVLPFLFIPVLSATMFLIISLPAAFFTIWLALHLVAYWKRK